MVVYDDSKFKEIMARFPTNSNMEIIDEIFKFFNRKIHDIYKHINDLERKKN